MPPRANLILIQEPEVFFTTETSDKDLIKRWLTYWKVEYLMFYASFLNHAIASVQRALDKNLTDGKEYALLVVLQDLPAHTQGFIDAMEAYFEGEWKGGAVSGLINLRGGKTASPQDIERAHAHLSKLLFTQQQREEFMGSRPELPWLNSEEVGRREQKRASKKKQKKGAREVTKGLGAMGMEDEE